jgi:glycosyltransferase involved in cell wall biosynthesis
MPLVSILVPAYSAARFLREALDSLLAQTYQNIEIILLDDLDDATPNRGGVCGPDHLVGQPRNLGIYGNVNAGIARARNDLIAAYHADDVYLPMIVERRSRISARIRRSERSSAQPSTSMRKAWNIAACRSAGSRRSPRLPDGAQRAAMYKNLYMMRPTTMVASVHRDVGSTNCSTGLRPISICGYALLAAINRGAQSLEKYRRFHGSSSGHHDRLRLHRRLFMILDRTAGGGDAVWRSPKRRQL